MTAVGEYVRMFVDCILDITVNVECNVARLLRLAPEQLSKSHPFDGRISAIFSQILDIFFSLSNKTKRETDTKHTLQMVKAQFWLLPCSTILLTRDILIIPCCQ